MEFAIGAKRTRPLVAAAQRVPDHAWTPAVGMAYLNAYWLTGDNLLREAATHVARYKLPKAFVFRDAIVRSPAGKADYRWAKETVVTRLGEG